MNQVFQAEQEVRALLEAYFQAVYEGDVGTLKGLFHESAAMYGYLGEELVAGTPQIFFDDLASKPPMSAGQVACRCVIEELSVTGSIASAKLFVDGFFGVATIRDCFHLVKAQGAWRIVCKTFTTL